MATRASMMIELDILRKEMWDVEADFHLSATMTDREYDLKINPLVTRANTLLLALYGEAGLDKKDCPCGLYHASDRNKANF